MNANNMNGHGRRRYRPSAADARRRRHEEAILQAEVRRLALAIQPFGILRRDLLAREAGAEHWGQVGFGSALQAAVDQGLLEPLPFGFYRETRSSDTPSSGAC
jgi:hypothetical protein